MAKAGRGSDQFQLRLPDGMRERIRLAADLNDRSMNAEIVAALHEAFPPQASYDEIAAEIAEVLETYRVDFEYRHLAKLRDLIGEVGRELESSRQLMDQPEDRVPDDDQ